ncbi:VanW family protein [Virgibacillus halophilus]|uniref:VanW family protein n=1 Tax=Tigheibacillus halophilus TaxID=361280 RepID=A0ABU5CC19_9BACI|nr:VanW family protein [Virgibacillus halophilus]
MLKKVVFILAAIGWLFTNSVGAQGAMIIHDKGVNETIYRDDFTIPATNHMLMDIKKIHILLERLSRQVHQEPVDAKLDANRKIIPEITGKKMDVDSFMTVFQEFLYHGSSKRISVPKTVVYPRVDSELLSNISANKIGSYVTRYKQSNKERSHNIVLAAEAINNHVLFPGESFSFNKVVGKRTKERGYKKSTSNCQR